MILTGVDPEPCAAISAAQRDRLSVGSRHFGVGVDFGFWRTRGSDHRSDTTMLPVTVTMAPRPPPAQCIRMARPKAVSRPLESRCLYCEVTLDF